MNNDSAAYDTNNTISSSGESSSEETTGNDIRQLDVRVLVKCLHNVLYSTCLNLVRRNMDVK